MNEKKNVGGRPPRNDNPKEARFYLAESTREKIDRISDRDQISKGRVVENAVELLEEYPEYWRSRLARQTTESKH